jgi:hypothetical protein
VVDTYKKLEDKMQKLSESLEATLLTLVAEEGIEWWMQGEDLVVLVRMPYINPESANPSYTQEGQRKSKKITLGLGENSFFENDSKMRVEPDGRERWVFNILQ